MVCGFSTRATERSGRCCSRPRASVTRKSSRTPLPAVIIDAVPGVDYDPILATENVGIIDIRSVYDLDGADVAPGGYASLIDPVQTTEAERPARFVRVEQAV